MKIAALTPPRAAVLHVLWDPGRDMQGLAQYPLPGQAASEPNILARADQLLAWVKGSPKSR